MAFIDRGVCIEQNSPQNLLKKYNCSTLEEVSYRICCNYDHVRNSSVNTSQISSKKPFLYLSYNNLKISKTHINALSWKLNTQLKTNMVIIALVVIISVSTIQLSSIAFGPPKNIPIALLDRDNTNLSRLFIASLDPKVFSVDLTKRVDTGIESVMKVKNMMFAEIQEGFTDRIKRLESGHFNDQDDLEETDNQMTKYGNLDSSDWLSPLLNTYSRNDSIKLYIDTTNAIPTYYSVIHTFIAFQKTLDKNREMFPNLNKQKNSFGIKIEELVRGRFDVKFNDSMVCGQMVFLTLFFALLFTSLILSIERASGVKHRDSVTGITKMESIITVFIFGTALTLISMVSVVISLHIFYDSLHLNRLYEAILLMLVVNVEGALLGVIYALCIKDKTRIVVRNNHNIYYYSLLILQD